MHKVDRENVVKMGQKMEQKWDRKEFNLAPPPKIVYSLLVFEY